MSAPQPDKNEIRRAADILHAGQIVELRSFKTAKGTRVGYYNGSHTALVDDTFTLGVPETTPNVYWTLQTIKPEVFEAQPTDRKYNLGTGNATCDRDILRYRWVPIDFDPKRTEPNATDAEKEAALKLVNEVREYLQDRGITTVLADSGNGYHLLIKVDLSVDQESFIKDFLSTMSARFSNDRVSVDTSLYNPSRILKAYGTVARKGPHTDERPWRSTRVMDAADIKLTSEPVLQSLLGDVRAEVKSTPKTAVVGSAMPTKQAAGIDKEKLYKLVLAGEKIRAQDPGHDNTLHSYAGYLREVKRMENYQEILEELISHTDQFVNRGDDFSEMLEKHARNVCKYPVGSEPGVAIVNGVPAGTKAPAVQQPATTTSPNKLKTKRANEVKTKRISWLWDYRIPFGKLSVLAGNPDQGKSLVTMYTVCQITNGLPLFGSPNALPACDVLVLAGEDEADDTIVPRLQAGGADLNRVHIVESVAVTDGKGLTVTEREAQLDTDIQAIETMLQEHPQIRLVIVDPLSNYLGRANMNREQEVRAVLVPLKNLAARTGVAIVAVMHLNKNGDASAIHRIGGAVAFSGVARAAWLFTEDPENPDKHLMLRIKGNIAKRIGGLVYRIQVKHVEIEGSAEPMPYVDWVGETEQSANDVLVAGQPGAGRPPEEMASAEKWLADFLSKGSELASDVKRFGLKAGHSYRTLVRAKAKLNVQSIKVSQKSWEWSLPETPEST